MSHEIAMHWRLNAQRYNLVGEVCPHCEEAIFPPRDICPSCRREARIPHTFSGKGEIYSFAPVMDAPEGFEAQAPYTVALIRLEEGPLVTAQLTDFGDRKPVIGEPVEMVTRKLKADGDKGMLVYGYKFRPPIRQPQEVRAY